MRLVINGITGKMGSYLFEYLKEKEELEVVAGLSRQQVDLGIPIFDNISSCLDQIEFDTLIDFSIYPNCLDVVKIAIMNKKNVVSGTTGYKKYDGQHIDYLAKEHEVGVMISPNYSLVDREFEKYLLQLKKTFPYVYITERHSIHKQDRPSGTAKYLGKLLEVEEENIQSMRIPGVIAHHEIIFSDLHQAFEVHHTINDREAFIKGIEQAIIEVTKEQHITIMI